MDHLNIPLQTPPMVSKNPFSVVLIRHGLSNMNIAFMEAGVDWNNHSEAKETILKDPNLIDAELHPIGVM